MAALTFGAGTSHSPMLLLDADGWPAWAQRMDPTMTDLADGDGTIRSFDDLAARNGDRLQEQLTHDAMSVKVDRCRTGVARLREQIAAASLDALIIIGDDQSEHLGPHNLPPILVYHGAELRNTAVALPDGTPPVIRTIASGYYEPDTDRAYPVDVPLAEHLIDALLDNGFDVATSNRLPAERPEGHAFQYVHRHLSPPDLATVPVLLNTYVPPAQPRARRCVQLGTAIRAAVEAMAGTRKVGILASGGLSHFLVDEDLDRRVLDACAAGDLDHLASIPEAALQSGSSEIKNWMVVAAACTHLRFQLIDYVPGYRTPAGTGTGLAFAAWT